MPSLKLVDDRAIRDSERQMAASLFEQKLVISSPLLPSSVDSKIKNTQNCSSAISARVKSVSNIAKRSAGMSDNEECGADLGSYNNVISLRFEHNNNNNQSKTNEENYNKPDAKAEEYSPRALKELGIRESLMYGQYNNNQNSDEYSNNNNICTPPSSAAAAASKELNRQKSFSYAATA